jgi:oligosaccharide repeat unit polymerase
MTDLVGSPWLAYSVLVIVTGISRMRCGSWFAPSAFVGMVWSFFTGASLAIADYSLPGRGLWMLVVLIVAVQLGALIAHELRPRSNSAISSDPSNTFDSLIAPCRRYGVICTIVALLGCLYFLFTSIEEFGLEFTPLGVLEVGARWTLLRYDDVVEPWSVRLLVTWFHPAGLLGGVLFASSRKTRDRVIAVTTLLPAVFYGVLTGARAAILLGLTCWIGGYIASQCVRSREQLTLFTGKRLALLLFTAVCMVGMFAAIDAIRATSWSQSLVLDIHEQKLSNYMLAPPAAFAEWYAHADVSTAEWGARTFAGEFDLLHLRTRIVGRHLDKSNVVGTETTNVYSLFRDLIEDFTPFCAVLIAAAVGGLAGWVYRDNFENARSALFWLSMFYAVFLYSPIVSLLSFNGAALAWLVGWFVLTRSKPRSSLLTLPQLAEEGT